MLELGAGVGRLTAALTSPAAQVTAVERDPGMIAALRARQGDDLADVEIVDADVTALPDLGVFGLVLLPTSLLNELPDARARRAVLREAAVRCRSDGCVVLHVLGPWWLVRLPDRSSGLLHPADRGAPVEVTIEAGELEAFRSRRHARLRYRFPDGEELDDDLDAAIVTPEELTDALRAAGLELIGRYGAVPPRPMTAEDPAWHLVARPREDADSPVGVAVRQDPVALLHGEGPRDPRDEQ